MFQRFIWGNRVRQEPTWMNKQLKRYSQCLQVNKVLRNHNIKPHWMFALDNIIRKAVQTAITILVPGNVISVSSGSRWNKLSLVSQGSADCLVIMGVYAGSYIHDRFCSFMTDVTARCSVECKTPKSSTCACGALL